MNEISAPMKTYYKHHEKYKKKGREAAKRRSSKLSELVQSLKDQPCVDCGVELPPRIMEFDHVRGSKLFTFGQISKLRIPSPFTSWEDAIAAEAKKCDVRCPNCHRMRHYLEDQTDKEERND